MNVFGGSYYNNILNADSIPTWPSLSGGNAIGASNPAYSFNFAASSGSLGDSLMLRTQTPTSGFSDALSQAIQSIGGLPTGLTVPSPIDPNTQAGKDALGNVEGLNALGYYALVSQNPKLWEEYLKSLNGVNLDAENKKAKESHIEGYSAEKGMLLKQAAEQRLKTKGSTTGYCAKGVNDVLQSLGVNITRGDAYQQADKIANNGNFKEIKGVSSADLKNLPPGAIVVWGKTSKSPYGHISIATGDGQEISDHKQAQITSLRGQTNFQVFIPV